MYVFVCMPVSVCGYMHVSMCVFVNASLCVCMPVLYMCVHAYVCMCLPHLECSKRTTQESILSFDHMDNQTHVKLGSKRLYPLSHKMELFL